MWAVVKGHLKCYCSCWNLDVGFQPQLNMSHLMCMQFHPHNKAPVNFDRSFSGPGTTFVSMATKMSACYVDAQSAAA